MITWAERAKAAIAQTHQSSTVKTDETAIARLLAVSSVSNAGVSSLPEQLSSVLAVLSPVVLEIHDSSIAVTEDMDRWCWPQSSAMNGAEIDTLAARLSHFTDKGLNRTDGETLADKLVIRDREQDDRVLCLECSHLRRSGLCGNWKRAGVAIHAKDAQLAPEFLQLLQRCDGFSGSHL